MLFDILMMEQGNKDDRGKKEGGGVRKSSDGLEARMHSDRGKL